MNDLMKTDPWISYHIHYNIDILNIYDLYNNETINILKILSIYFLMIKSFCSKIILLIEHCSIYLHHKYLKFFIK